MSRTHCQKLDKHQFLLQRLRSSSCDCYFHLRVLEDCGRFIFRHNMPLTRSKRVAVASNTAAESDGGQEARNDIPVASGERETLSVGRSLRSRRSDIK